MRTVLSSGDPYQRGASEGLGFALGGELWELLLMREVCEACKAGLKIRKVSGFGKRQHCKSPAKGR